MPSPSVIPAGTGSQTPPQFIPLDGTTNTAGDANVAGNFNLAGEGRIEGLLKLALGIYSLAPLTLKQSSAPIADTTEAFFYSKSDGTYAQPFVMGGDGVEHNLAIPVGFANPMTTQDDLIVGDASGAATRLGKGANGTVLTINPSGHAAWIAPATPPPSTTLQVGSGSALSGALTLAAGSHVTATEDSGTGTFTIGLTSDVLINPMTGQNDLILGGTGGTATRLATVASKVLVTDAFGAVSWGGVPGNTLTGDLTVPGVIYDQNAPPFTSLRGLVNLGDGGFAGGSGSFNGNAAGTYLAINTNALSAYYSAVLTDAPRVYYRLGEASGTVAVDYSGNARNGTYTTGTNLTQGVTGATTGDGDKAIQVNGTNASVFSHTFATGDLPSGSAAFALVCYWKTSANIGYPGGMDLFNLGTVTVSLNGNAGQANSVQIVIGGNRSYFLTNTNLADGAYHQLYMNWSGSTWTVLIDGGGTFQPAAGSNWNISPGQSGTPTLEIGGSYWFGGTNGSIDEISIFSGSLSSTRAAVYRSAASQSNFYPGNFFDFEVNGVSLASMSGTGTLAVSALTVGGKTLLNPMTTAGDIIIGGASGAMTRLAATTNGYILTLSGGSPVWAAATGGMTNPMTTVGDMMIGGASGAATRLPPGTNGYVLTMVSGSPAWAAATGGGGGGTIIQGGASTKVQLDYTLNSDITAVVGTVGGWVDTGISGTFNVDDAASIVEFSVDAMGFVTAGGIAEHGTRLVIDGTINKQLGGGYTYVSGNMYNAFAGVGVIPLSGLAAGTHTWKIQFITSGAGNFYCRASSSAPYEFFNARVLERKVTMNTSAAPVSGARLYRSTAQSIPSGAWTQLTFNAVSFDTDSLKGTGASPYNQLVVTKAGKYNIGASVAYVSSGSLLNAGCRIKVNGVVVDIMEQGTSAGYPASPRVNTEVDLAVGDVITAEARQNSGGALNTSNTDSDGGVDQTTQLYAMSCGGIVSGTAQSKVQLNWTPTAGSDFSNGTVTYPNGSFGTIIDFGTFTVDDANSTIDCYLNIGALLVGAAVEVGLQLLVDSTAYAIGGTPLQSSGGTSLPTGTINIGSLAAGSHTIKLQANGNAATGTFYLRNNTRAAFEGGRFQVIERKLVPASPSYANVNKVQLDYLASSSTDLANAQAVAVATWVSPTNWVDQTFTVDDPNSIVEVNVGGSAVMGAGAATNVSSSVVIDPAGANVRYLLGGDWVPAGANGNVLAGAPQLLLTGLTVGTHTLRFQVYSLNQNATFYCQSATASNIEALRIKVVERKVVNTGAGGVLDYCKARQTSGQSLTGGTETAITWNVEDWDYNSMHSTATNTSRFTPQVPGTYKVSGVLTYSGASGTGNRQAYVTLNGVTGTDYGFVGLTARGGGSRTTVPFEAEVFCNGSTDYIEVQGYQDSGGALALDTADNWVTVRRVDGYAINPMTQPQDMIIGGTGGVPTRLPTVRGRVNSDGTVGSGSGFTASRVATGQYRVAFGSAMPLVPYVFAQAQVGGEFASARSTWVSNVTVNGFSCEIANSANADVDNAFSFMVLGQ